MVSALVLALLAADPQVHGGAAAAVGLGVPFKNLNAGVQFSLKVWGEVEVQPKICAGLTLPVGFGFFNQNIGAGVVSSWTAVDLMPGVRGSYAVLDWVRAVFELGVGPSIVSVKTNLFGTTIEQSRTDFGMRGALLVELAPPSLQGVMFTIEPVALQGRFASASFSEYRFSVGVGYRR